MLATNGDTVIRVATLCAVLLRLGAARGENATGKRSLNNYVATSVPYIVDHAAVHGDELSGTAAEKADSALAAADAHSQHMLDCLNNNHCANNVTVGEHPSVEGTFKPYSQDELNKILQKYEGDKENLEAQESSNKVQTNYYSIASSNNIESSSQPGDPHDKSKAWNVINYSQNYNKNPYDDRMGWVTLEPIAWSSSQVQKWEPNTKPSWPIPSQAGGPWGSGGQYQQQPSYGGFSERPYKKPTYQYQSKPWNANQNFGKPQFGEHLGNQEIITDGQPGYFPAERPSSQASYRPWLEHTQSISYLDSGNRPATHVVYQGIGTGGHAHHIPDREPPQASSAEGDGHWVLLSSTKGYSVPHRQRSSSGRSLDLDDEKSPKSGDKKEEKRERPLSARRSIRLTVLPPLNGAGATKTSHNGLIEVENSDQTVEEAHREHFARMMKFGNSTTDNEVRIRGTSFHGIPAKIEAVAKPAERRNAILSAVGAGMIPATMAMILPMILGRRKRSVHQPQVLTLSVKNYGASAATVVKYPKKWSEAPKKKIMY